MCDDGLRNESKVKFVARTGKGLKRLAARTAGAMVMVVMYGGIRSGER